MPPADEAMDGSPEVTEGRSPEPSEVTPERAEAPDAAVKVPGAVGQSVHLKCLRFNQDCSHFIAGTTAGFRVFRTAPCGELFRRENLPAFRSGSVSVAAMKFKTPLFPMVVTDADGSGACRVKVWDDKQGKFIGELHSRSEARAVLARNDIFAIVCEHGVIVYSLSTWKAVLSMVSTSNAHGAAALTAAGEPWVLCCPGEALGEVRVQVGLSESTTFKAHEKAIAAIALDERGSLIATASEYGSRVKVFKREGAQLLYRLRLSSLGAGQTVASMAFHSSLGVLGVACASDPNVFFFRCEDVEPEEAGTAMKRQGSGGFAGFLSSVVPEFLSDASPIGSFLIPDVAQDGRPGTDARDRQAGIRGPVLGFHGSEPRLWVLHYDGMLHEVELRLAEATERPALEAKLACSTLWFASRPDFRLPKKALEPLAEDEEFGDQWHLL